MAKILTPLGGEWTPAAFGGIIQTTHRDSQVCRSKTARPISQNPAQLRLQGILTRLVSAWKALAPEYRELWYVGKDYWSNRLDYSYPNHISSWNWYMIINARRLLAGLEIIDLAPFTLNPPNVQDFAAAPGLGRNLNCSWTPTDAGYFLEIFAEPARPGQRKPFAHLAVFNTRPEGDAGAATVTPTGYGWINLHYSVMDKATGLVSDFQTFTVEST